jgi:hypothetical protein
MSNINKFLCKFLADIGTKKEIKSFEEVKIGDIFPCEAIGYITVFNRNSIQENINYISKEGNNGSIFEDLFMRYMMRGNSEYDIEAFKLYCRIAELTSDKINFSDDDLSAKAYNYLKCFIENKEG